MTPTVCQLAERKSQYCDGGRDRLGACRAGVAVVPGVLSMVGMAALSRRDHDRDSARLARTP